MNLHRGLQTCIELRSWRLLLPLGLSRVVGTASWLSVSSRRSINYRDIGESEREARLDALLGFVIIVMGRLQFRNPKFDLVYSFCLLNSLCRLHSWSISPHGLTNNFPRAGSVCTNSLG